MGEAPVREHAPPTRSAQVKAFLIGSKAYDNIAFDAFQSLFPVGIRSSQSVRYLYKQYKNHRKALRERVAENVDAELSELLKESEATSPQNQEPTGTIQDAIAYLQSRKREAQIRKKKIDEDNKRYKAEVESFLREVEALRIPITLTTDEIPMEYTKNLLEVLSK